MNLLQNLHVGDGSAAGSPCGMVVMARALRTTHPWALARCLVGWYERLSTTTVGVYIHINQCGEINFTFDRHPCLVRYLREYGYYPYALTTSTRKPRVSVPVLTTNHENNVAASQPALPIGFLALHASLQLTVAYQGQHLARWRSDTITASTLPRQLQAQDLQHHRRQI